LYSGELDFQSPLGGVYLRDVLQQKGQAMRSGVEQAIPMVVGKLRDEGAYIEQMVSEYSVTIPRLDLVPERTRKTERYEQVHGSQLIEQVFIPDRFYRVWVVTFNVPYAGDIELIQYVPRTGTDVGWRPEVTVRDGLIRFETQTLDVDGEQKVELIKQQKQSVVTCLQKCVDAITPELEEFNQGVAREVPSLFQTLKEKHQRDRDILAQL
jgi:hypothetical protein